MVSMISSSTYATSFNVTRKVSIASGEEAVRVPIGAHVLDSKIKYVSRPRNRQAAYRLAAITNQPDFPLLPGPVSIFAGPDYLGKTFLSQFVPPGDEFDLPFGQDSYIEVERKLLANKVNHKGSKIQRDQTIKIILANRSSEIRDISVEENLPVAEDSRIKIKIQEMLPDSKQADIEDKTKAEWTVRLDPGEEQEIILSYRIEYPSEIQISGL
jgi:uncharacterized protein (TIGR02231 family)